MYHRVKFGVFTAVVALAICAGAAEYDVAAYVWPAYQNEPRWAELGIFKDGKGEWQNVYEARPKWEGHNQPLVPLWGYEDESDPKVVEKKIDAAVSHGVNVFVYDWYWYGGRPFLEDALDKGFLGAANNGKMKFFIMYANHHVTRLWDNKVANKEWDKPIWRAWVDAEEFRKISRRWIEMYFSRPNYYRIGGKPVLMVYEIGTLVEGLGGIDKAAKALAAFRKECEDAGLGGVHLMVCDYALDRKTLEALGVDSATIYNFVHWAGDAGDPDYLDWAKKGAARFDAAKKELGLSAYFPHASVGWDTNPRYPQDFITPTIHDSTPAKFEQVLRMARDWSDANTPEGFPKLITVNSWNEWTEGSYLEPDTTFGFGYLEAIQKVFGSGAAFDIRDFGAGMNGVCTAAIQKALDAAEAAGGGTVVVPTGTWTTGTVYLRSHVELRLEKGAVLKGSTRREDYNPNDAFPENFWSKGEEWSGGHLVVGYKVVGASIIGEGTIDGSGPEFFGECEEDSWFPWYKYGLKLHPLDREWFRPGPMVAFFLSKDIRLSGVTLANTPCWTVHFRCCDGLDIRGVTIDADRTIANSDGFSIDCSRNVIVDGCTVKSGDDGFAIRASCRQPGHAEAHPCENIRISNCDIWSCCYGIRFGVGTGTVRNAVVENCRIHESANGVAFTPSWKPGRKGVYIENIRVSKCEVLECARPVESYDKSDDWIIRDITFEDCRFESLKPISLRGSAARNPEKVTFRNCSRNHLDRVRVRNRGGWGGERSRKFIEGCKVDGLTVENCSPAE